MTTTPSDRDFRLLWTGNALDKTGSALQLGTIPLIAVFVLDSTSWQMGMLNAAGTLAFLVLGLPIGALVDRTRRRGLMQTAGLVRAALLLGLLVASTLGWLDFTLLLVATTAVGVLTVVYDVAAPAYLPSLVGRQNLVRYNAKIYSVQALANSSGHAVSGALAQLIGSMNAILAGVIAFFGSSGVLSLIRTEEAHPAAGRSSRLGAEIREGVRYVFTDRLLRPTLACSATFTFFRNVAMTVLALFLARELGLTPLWAGGLISLFGIGGVVGSLTATWWFRTFGELRAMWVVLLVCQPMMALVALAGPGAGLLLPALGALGCGYGGQVYNVGQISIRQQVLEDRLMGRVNASIRFVTWGVLPIGAAAGGALGELIGLRATLWVSAVGGVAAVGWLLGPLRGLHRLADLPEDPPGPGR